MTCRPVILVLAVLTVSASFALEPTAARAQDGGLAFDWHGALSPCAGDCAVHLYGGRQTTTSPGMAFGFADITQGDYGFVLPTPVWAYEWEDFGRLRLRPLARIRLSHQQRHRHPRVRSGSRGRETFRRPDRGGILGRALPALEMVPLERRGQDQFRGLDRAQLRLRHLRLRASGQRQRRRVAADAFLLARDHPRVSRPTRPRARLAHAPSLRHPGRQGDKGAPGFALFNYADTGATFATVGLRYRF